MNVRKLYLDYLPDDTVFTDDEQKIHKLKHIIFDKLTEADRRIIILYAELHSIRKVANLLNISAASAWIQITRIRNIIKEEYGN